MRLNLILARPQQVWHPQKKHGSGVDQCERGHRSRLNPINQGQSTSRGFVKPDRVKRHKLVFAVWPHFKLKLLLRSRESRQRICAKTLLPLYQNRWAVNQSNTFWMLLVDGCVEQIHWGVQSKLCRLSSIFGRDSPNFQRCRRRFAADRSC